MAITEVKKKKQDSVEFLMHTPVPSEFESWLILTDLRTTLALQYYVSWSEDRVPLLSSYECDSRQRP